MSSQHEERYCAFVDILGFSELIGSLRGGTVHYETIRDLLKQIHQPHDPQFVGLDDTDFQAQSFSDAVALSTRSTATGLAILFDTLERLSLALLHEGYFVRGGLCRGMLYHDQNMVFGEALIKAYRMESDVAKYPRIMLTKDVIDGAMASNLKQYFVDHIKQAPDGPYFLHVLQPLRMMLDVHKSRAQTEPPSDFSRFVTIQEQIQRRFWDSVDVPRHFEKVQWFANYWNVSLGEDHDLLKLVTGPGLFQMRFFGM